MSVCAYIWRQLYVAVFRGLFNMEVSKMMWLKRLVKFALLTSLILWIITAWYGFPRLHEEEDCRISKKKLIKKLKEVEEKLRLQDEDEFRKMVESKPKIPKSMLKSLRRLPKNKIVHLDLKGAAPKMSYLLTLLPILKSMGATGLLVEYEDMFPYRGYIRILSSRNAYGYDDISAFLKTAKELNMNVIPLIQTLGHFEFVLKHSEFAHLRETKNYANMPCPLHTETLELVKKMVDQVLQRHPDITHIHLGGDEVFNLKDCDVCKKSGQSKEHLFLYHMIPLLNHVKAVTNSRVKPIIWDDMLRRWSINDMKQIAPLADIMVWGYVPKLDSYGQFPKEMWGKYEKVFNSVWVASSFKGALTADNNLVPIKMHIQNHESWLNVTSKINIPILGVALTGWSRYDHFAVLCELLPAAIPSLGLSLGVLREGLYKKRVKETVESTLGFSSPIVITKDFMGSWDIKVPNFPGGEIYSLVAELENHISWYKGTKNRLDSWANDRIVEENKVSFFHLSAVENSLKQILNSFQKFRLKCFSVLPRYFFEDTVNEWVRDKVDYYIKLSEQLESRVNGIKNAIIL